MSSQLTAADWTRWLMKIVIVAAAAALAAVMVQNWLVGETNPGVTGGVVGGVVAAAMGRPSKKEVS